MTIRVNVPGSPAIELPAAEGPYRLRVWPPDSLPRVVEDYTKRRAEEDGGDPKLHEQRRRGGLHRWGKFDDDEE